MARKLISIITQKQIQYPSKGSVLITEKVVHGAQPSRHELELQKDGGVIVRQPGCDRFMYIPPGWAAMEFQEVAEAK